MKTEEITYLAGALSCRGHLALPDLPGRRPGVLVAHPGLGLNDHTMERADQLAGLGYVALAVDLYGDRQLATGIEGGRKLSAPLHADHGLLRARVQAGLDLLTLRPEVDGGRLGAIGFCFGGLAVLELARSGAPLAAVVTFHGLLNNDEPGSAANIRGNVLVCTGADDPLVPAEAVAAFQVEMRRTKVTWQVNVYGGAKHAFTRPGVTAEDSAFGYSPRADRDSWSAMKAWFEDAFA